MFKFIPSMQTGVIQTFGKFSRLARPGLNFYIPFIQTCTTLSNKLFQKQFSINVRTYDKVFPQIQLSLQYRVKPQDTQLAFFTFANDLQQMQSYTCNVIRKQASQSTLDQLFQSHHQISDVIMNEVGPLMLKGGYTIESVQIKNIIPPKQLKQTMNQINSSQRRKIILANQGQAQAKKRMWKGKGIALQRDQITKGWTQSIKTMSEQAGITPIQAMNFLLNIREQQTKCYMSEKAGTKVIFTGQSNKLMQSLQIK